MPAGIRVCREMSGFMKGEQQKMLIVKKFGGTSVGDKERINRVADRCIADYKEGHDVVVVLSAMGKSTDELIAKAKDINPNPPKRELDMLVSVGEQISVSLMAMAMAAKGVAAVSLNAFQVAMHTTQAYTNARLTSIDADRIRAELEARKIVIVTGFQGVDKADKCEIFTDVDGVYTADPRIVKNARKLDVISYDEMLELASLGAGVLHNRSVEMAKKYGVELVVRSSLNYNEGTVVKEDTKMEKMLVSGVACDKNVARIAVIGLQDQPGVAFKLFNHLANHNINVDVILQSIGRDGTKDISFTVAADAVDEALAVMENHRQTSLICEKIDVERNIAKVSVVGAGMTSNAGVAAKMFEALYDAGINIKMISTSEIKISVLIDAAFADGAMNAIHAKFIG